ncbi:MAG TPA: FAD-dependent oxidoreductase [Polyangiales bacterium]|nr:FAD-dependent oxidoreductase [Polyangiales bacterium]
MSTRVVIIGAGVGGLATALALKNSNYEVTLLERDPEPPDIPPEQAFEAWARPGVPQFRHAHILLARLQTTLRDHHPELLQELLDAGLELSTVEEVLPSARYPHYEPPPKDDADMLHLWGRRPTFEFVIRRYVGRLPNVRFMHSVKVTDLLTEKVGSALRVRGVEFTRDAETETLLADIVIDASGVRTKLPEMLRAKGARIDVDLNPSGFVYSCRHYRLKDPAAAPKREDGGGNLDFLGYATFYAEHGHYALTFGCPVEETELAHAIARPEGFEALCEQLPVLRHWTRNSEPTSKVLGAGKFENRWLRYRTSGPELLDYFAVGDSHVETNPMYGRGCASAFVQSTVLGAVLAETSDPSQRSRLYYERSRQLLQPYFQMAIATDRIYHTRAKLKRGLPVAGPERLINYLYESAFLPATYSSALMAREFLKSVQMREGSGVGTRFLVLFHLARAWLGTLLGKKTQPLLAPPRAEFLRSAGVSEQVSE